MKVFIVSTGSYSDYRIEKLFLNQEKADTYAKLIHGSVEEFETSDDSLQTELDSAKEYTIVQFSYRRFLKKEKTFNVMDLSTWFKSDQDMFQEKTSIDFEEEFRFGYYFRNSIYDKVYHIDVKMRSNENQFKIFQNDEHQLVITRILESNHPLDNKKM